MKKRLLLMSLCLTGLKLLAQSSGPSDLYLKTMNSFVPGSPEAAQIMKYQDYPVNLFTGTPEISVPIYTLAGKGISVPISLSYHSGGGVKVDEQATNVGLGWLLNAGGEITREIRGGVDEGGVGTLGYFHNPHPMSYYIERYNCCVFGRTIFDPSEINNHTDQQMWADAMNGTYDLQPDIFYFSAGGHSGKFMFDDSLQQFVCLTSNTRVNISFTSTSSNSSFTIIDDDGCKYIFANMESSSSQILNLGIPAHATSVSPPQTTSWKLSKIINADATDSILFTYATEHYGYYTQGANVTYQAINTTLGTHNPVLSYSYSTLDGQAKLSNISGSAFSVDFVDETANRLDIGTGTDSKALGKVLVKNKNNDILDVFVFHHSYFDRPAAVGNLPVISGTLLTKSLRLDSISDYGNSESNGYPLKHKFTYDDTPLPTRLSYAQDWWGYANTNTFADNMVPPTMFNDGSSHVGANRQPDIAKTSAGILKNIQLPTGGMVSYEYEPNTSPLSVEQSAPNPNMILSVEQTIAEWINAPQLFWDSTTHFTINQPPNANNNFTSGAVAIISFDPAIPAQPNSNINTDYPYFTIDKTAEADGSPVAGPLVEFHLITQNSNLSNVLLPNGQYTMTFHLNNYNYHLPPLCPPPDCPQGRHIVLKVAYHTLNTSAGYINYNLAGLRIKSITSTDQYSNVTNLRKFRYHDPVTDSSYGVFIGSAIHKYIESLGYAGGGDQNLVSMGTNSMPGMGCVASSVIYPKVIEDITDNGITYRTEHYYTRGINFYPLYSTIWPFTPATDIECGRGNEYKTVWNKFSGSAFTPIKVKQQVFNFDPLTYNYPNRPFQKTVSGIKCSTSSYFEASTIAGGYPPAYINLYSTYINRLYLTSDSTTTYDLNGSASATEWHDYTYGDNNAQPMIIRSGNSDGSVSIQKNYYASDMPDANSNIDATLASQMTAANRVTQPLGTIQMKDGQQLSQQYTNGHFNGSQLLVDNMKQSLLNNPLDVEISVLSYSPAANPLSILLRGNKYRKYIWNDKLNLPLATCVMGQDSKFVFTSFEYPNEIPWTEASRTTSNAFSGSYAYSLNGSLVISGMGSTTGTDVYVWSTGSNILANGITLSSTGKTKGSWTLYTAHVPNAANITLSGNALIDQLLVLPTGSQFQGNVYDSFNRITAVVNDQIITSFYEYDNFGRLSNVKDEKGNILKSTSYQYQGPQ